MSNNMSYVFDMSCLDISCNRRMNEGRKKEYLHPMYPVSLPEFRSPRTDEVILYYYPFSYYSQVVLMALFYRQIPFTGQSLDIRRGDQFVEAFLDLCPRGEVPVFQDGINELCLTDSLDIIKHMENSTSLGAMGSNLYPDDPTERYRCDEFARKIHRLKLDALTFGMVLFTDLDNDPQGQFETKQSRDTMREYLRKRRAIYRTEALNYPQHAGALKRKLDDVQHDWHYFENREDYEHLLVSVERELDECEAELGSRHHRASHPTRKGSMVGKESWWLVSAHMSIADVFLGMLLWRVYELGFYRRIIEPRPHLMRYFERIKGEESFYRTTHPNMVDMAAASSSADLYLKNIPWYLLAIPITTMIVYAIWGYRTRRSTNRYGYYTLVAAAFYANWLPSRHGRPTSSQLKLPPSNHT